jgi:hypothetical protein
MFHSSVISDWSADSNSHCPWVYNCIGVNNHRHFFIYLINLTLGVLVYDYLTYLCTSHVTS